MSEITVRHLYAATVQIRTISSLGGKQFIPVGIVYYASLQLIIYHISNGNYRST